MKSFLLAGMFAISVAAEQKGERWWPTQALPKSIIRSGGAGYDFMRQSVAGLAAKSVNEGRSDELVWIASGVDLEDWLGRWLKKHPEIKTGETLEPWDLVDHFAKRGVIKGYILYRADDSKGDLNAHRAGMDLSVNIATSMAGLLDGIIVEEQLEKEAVAHGLTKLLDARGKTQTWCFETYKDKFNRAMLCTQDPKKPHVRDLAIAQKALTIYGATPTPAVMEWLQPLSPILGWNGGDEFETTDLSSRFGHIQTATDWCMNLPVLMAGSESTETRTLKSFAPGSIDWNDQRSAISFVQTDGDNVQWHQGNFFRHPSYWGSPDRGKIPYGWSCCFSEMVQLCPQTIDYALETKSGNDFFIEWGGGYYYPDHFGSDRKERWQLLGQQMRRTWALMKKSNLRVIGFNVAKYDSADARKAYEVIARETEGLLGILIFQYSPYEEGAGSSYWVKDKQGIELPVLTARYSIWEHSNQRPRSGTPAKVAREIREATEKNPNKPRYDWAISHVWSYFKNAPGLDESAENLPQEKQSEGLRGYTPVTWCAERLPEKIRVIGPEELLWRIRMQHDPEATKRLISGRP